MGQTDFLRVADDRVAGQLLKQMYRPRDAQSGEFSHLFHPQRLQRILIDVPLHPHHEFVSAAGRIRLGDRLDRQAVKRQA
ncbi:hypothetical protein D3C73_1390140 [compost metagenome]